MFSNTDKTFNPDDDSGLSGLSAIAAAGASGPLAGAGASLPDERPASSFLGAVMDGAVLCALHSSPPHLCCRVELQQALAPALPVWHSCLLTGHDEARPLLGLSSPRPTHF